MDRITDTTLESHATCWHILTCEYPPKVGGVSDYTAQVAEGLVGRGAMVHVWCAATTTKIEQLNGVVIHWVEGHYDTNFRRSMSAHLDNQQGPYRILVQYAPHGFGLRAMNVPFCWWLLQRKRKHGGDIRIMFHEVAYPFVWWPIRHIPLGWVTRLMAGMLVRAASRVYISIPGWSDILRPVSPSNQKFEWLPVPSGIEKPKSEARAIEIRRKCLSETAGKAQHLVGHFGLYSQWVTMLLRPIIIDLMQNDDSISVLLIGRGSDHFGQQLVQEFPELQSKIHFTGQLESADVANHILACDVMMQPFPDGISTRRSSVMASMAMGVPVVSTRGFLTESIWSECGLIPLSDPSDVKTFVQNVRGLLDDPELRAVRSEQLKAFYEQRFSIEKLLDALEAS